MEPFTSNYFGLPEDFSSHENSKVVIVPVPYEATTSYGKGTKNGPNAVLEASQEVEQFDDELWVEPFKVGIHTSQAVEMSPVANEDKDPFQELSAVIRPL